jgi:hypothetical protein
VWLLENRPGRDLARAGWMRHKDGPSWLGLQHFFG